MRSEQINELAAALSKAQGAMKNAAFDKQNPHYRSSYASLASITEAIKAPLAANGLSYSQTTEIRDGGFVLVTTLMHSSGQFIASEYPLPQAAKPQELGSALTYARRYSLSAIACIAADDDDDAEGARQSNQTASTPSPKASPIKPVKTEPPVNPETGEVSPHVITAPDAMAWGQAFVAAVQSARSAGEIDQWEADNAEGLETLKSAAPKAYQRVETRIAEKRATFTKREAA